MRSSRFPDIVDDVTVRLIAAVVLLVSAATLATQQWWLLAPLAVDFTLRATLGPRRSPAARLVQAWVRPRAAGGWRTVIFKALESLLGLCVGCVLFGQLMRLGVVPEEVCLDCADITRRAQVRAPSS